MRIALLQHAPALGELAANVRTVLDGAHEAADKGAELLVTPEMGLTGWTLRDPQLRMRLAAEVESEAIPALQAAAAEHGLTIVVGGPLPAGDGAANCAVALTPDGARAVHRKVHLFGDEGSWWAAGDHVEIVRTGGVGVGPLICYDGEFPEVPRLLRLAGADIIAVATTNMTPYERDQDVLFAARALENECVVAVCNRVGSENAWSYFGRSLVADTRGRIVARAGGGEELLVADVDVSEGSDPALGYLGRRRPAVYAPLADADDGYLQARGTGAGVHSLDLAAASGA